MNQTVEMNERTYDVDLLELWHLFVQRLPIILLAAVVAVSAFGIFAFITYTPEYSSTATLYILRQNEDTQSAQTAYNEINLASKVVNDCTHMLKSRSVLEPIIKELELNMTYEQLSDQVSTNNPTDTRILEVTVTGVSPEQAKQIVDRLCEIGQEKIAKAMGYDQVNLFEYGTTPQEPSNKTGIKAYILVGFVVALLTYSVFVVIHLVDDRIRSDEDVEQLLGLSILATIPDVNAVHKNKYGYYGGYGVTQKPAKKKTNPIFGNINANFKETRE